MEEYAVLLLLLIWVKKKKVTIKFSENRGKRLNLQFPTIITLPL